MSPVRFNCQHCNTSFPIRFQEHRFACPQCGSRYRLLHSRQGFEWAPDLSGPAWQTQAIRPVSEGFIFPEKEILLEGANLGQARLRQIQRQSRKSHRRTAALVVLSLILAVLYMLTPLASPVVQAIASSAENWLQNPQNPPAKAPESLFPGGLPTATPTNVPPTARPTFTPTATFVPSTSTSAPTHTPLPSATPLPLDLLIATAWQATVDQAVVESHAIQTADALQWSTTQTALPPILTALSEERALIATQTAEARSTTQH